MRPRSSWADIDCGRGIPRFVASPTHIELSHRRTAPCLPRAGATTRKATLFLHHDACLDTMVVDCCFEPQRSAIIPGHSAACMQTYAYTISASARARLREWRIADGTSVGAREGNASQTCKCARAVDGRKRMGTNSHHKLRALRPHRPHCYPTAQRALPLCKVLHTNPCCATSNLILAIRSSFWPQRCITQPLRPIPLGRPSAQRRTRTHCRFSPSYINPLATCSRQGTPSRQADNLLSPLAPYVPFLWRHTQTELNAYVEPTRDSRPSGRAPAIAIAGSCETQTKGPRDRVLREFRQPRAWVLRQIPRPQYYICAGAS